MTSDALARAIDFERRLAAENAAAAPEGLDAIRAVNTRMMAEREGEIPADVRIESCDAGGVPAEWISQGEGSSDAVVLFLHSGGCVVGAAAENRRWLARLSAATGSRVLAIDFRLAPEHPWPAQPEDACTAYRWLVQQGHAGDEIVVVGESGGGGVALAAAQRLRAAGDPAPGALVLLSPLVDLALTAPSLDANAGTDPFVSREALEGMMGAVLQGQDAAASSPLNGELAGLPPLLVQVGTAEAIYDDGRRLVERASAAGVDARLEPWTDMIHLWHGFPDLPEAGEAIDAIARFVAEHVPAKA